ncbi:MAG: DNA-formamidopyrimidine glycosylase family protein [Verrucomicrobiota bacterium]
MPELAEVEFSRRQWNPGLGQKITRLSLHPKTRLFRDTFPAKLRKTLLNQTLAASRAHGKRLFFCFTPSHVSRSSSSSAPTTPRPRAPTSARISGSSVTLELHLGMAGRLECRPPKHKPAKHDHFVLYQTHQTLVFNDYRQFGRLLLHTDDPTPWAELPPEPQDPAFTPKHLRALLARHPKLPIKAFLLDQTAFPGVGNWMADEILWRARLHPDLPAAQVDTAQLLKPLRFVCKGALKYVADQPTQNPSNKLAHHTEPPTWGSPPKSWLFQHRWSNDLTCPRCHTPLVREKLRARTACFCPKCQS